METIKERAKKYVNSFRYLNLEDYDDGLRCGRNEGYIKGATEQREIDIEKACEYLRFHIFGHYPTREKIIEDFRKAMKGE